MYYRVELTSQRSGGAIIEDNPILRCQTALYRVVMFSCNYDIPLDTLIHANDQVALLGDSFFDVIPPADSNGMIDSSFCARDEQHNNRLVARDKIVEFCSGVTESDSLGGESHLIWEYIFETARRGVDENLPSRLGCRFLFTNPRDARRYAAEQGYELYSLHEARVLFSENMAIYDMKWLDNIPLSATAREALECAVSYWKGEHTAAPLLEVLLWGEYELGAKL